jgi:glycine betaine/proline transport system permease protein
MPPLAILQEDLVPKIPLAEWAESFVDGVTDTFSGFFGIVQESLEALVGVFETILSAPPELLMIAILAGVALYLSGWRVALFALLGFLLIVSLELWDDAMLTLALVLASTVVSLLIGIPLGILAAQSRSVSSVVKPALDVAQTMPAFVYLVPMVVLLGLGVAPALIATVIFAMPPAVRLTMLGIQQVPQNTVEAAHAFGATRWQTLAKVELPQALPTIMAGVNQVIMLALSMVVIAAFVGAGGLGEVVVRGLGQLDVGLAFVGGIGIVIIAIYLDRVTRRLGGRRQSGAKGGGGGRKLLPSRARKSEEGGNLATVGAGTSSGGSGT